MPLETRDELLAAIADWLARNDIDTARAADFVRLFEAQADRVLRTRQAERIETLDMVAGEPTIPLPPDVRAVRSVRLVGGGVLEPLPVEALALPRSAVPGRPRFWAVAGWSLHLAPVPDAAHALEIRHLGGLCRLSAARPSNWLLKRHPDAYLYGALWQAALYVADDRAAATYRPLTEAALAAIEAAEAGAIGAGAGITQAAGPLVTRAG